MFLVQDQNKNMVDLVSNLKKRSFTHMDIKEVNSLVWEVMEKVDRGEYAPKDFYSDRP